MKAAELVRRLRPFAGCDSRIHGPAHWARVYRFGSLLADAVGLNLEQRRCVAVFAWTHDLARWDDDGGSEHAIAGAHHLDKVVPALFPQLDVTEVEVIRAAIRHHAGSANAEEALHQGWFDGLPWEKGQLLDTIGCCWDADRLDLLRLGIEPREERMSTACWQDLLPLARRLNKAAPDEF